MAGDARGHDGVTQPKPSTASIQWVHHQPVKHAQQGLESNACIGIHHRGLGVQSSNRRSRCLPGDLGSEGQSVKPRLPACRGVICHVVIGSSLGGDSLRRDSFRLASPCNCSLGHTRILRDRWALGGGRRGRSTCGASRSGGRFRRWKHEAEANLLAGPDSKICNPCKHTSHGMSATVSKQQRVIVGMTGSARNVPAMVVPHALQAQRPKAGE
jgi:hypothetical protein